jgi:hypothetical protein
MGGCFVFEYLCFFSFKVRTDVDADQILKLQVWAVTTKFILTFGELLCYDVHEILCTLFLFIANANYRWMLHDLLHNLHLYFQ